ncbi:MAG: leucine-rich repeat protein, partial [Prevotellaceae bacterium]|nr:leucine-rich repeat protein [Prevotellaceae bacterium]
MKTKILTIGLAAALLANVGAKAQTAILSETFEEGSGTALAGWTFANDGQTNRWRVGAVAGNGAAAAGSKAAYISDDEGSYHYATDSSSVAHLYTDVTLSSTSSLTISFDWKGSGENGFDDLQVFLVEATVTPTAGEPLGNPLATFSGSDSWRQASITVPALKGNKRLVFSWRNDESLGKQPPAAIDNVTVTGAPLTLIPSMTAALTAAGTLQSVANIAGVQKLTLTGSIDARDVKFMRDNMLFLTELDLSGATVVAYEGEDGTYPWWNSYPANEMPQYSFCNVSSYPYFAKTSLTSVKLPAGLTSIGEDAFNGCSGLSGNLTLPAGLTSIGSGAFYSCSELSDSLTLPAGLTAIGDWAFENCSGLSGNLTLPAGLTFIG